MLTIHNNFDNIFLANEYEMEYWIQFVHKFIILGGKCMKKLLTLLLSGCILISSLVACSGGESATGSTSAAASAKAESVSSEKANVNSDGTVNNPETVAVDKDKLIFWSLFSGGDGAYMDKIVKEYNATNPKKQVQSVMLVWADYYTKLATAVAAGKGPDIGVSHISKLPELVDEGIVVPIDNYTKNSGTDWTQYTDSMNAGVSFNGSHYAMPLDTHAQILYINKDLIQKANIKLNSSGQLDIKTVDDFRGMLGKLKSIMPDGSSALGLPQKGEDPYRVWWATYFQMGGTPLVNDAGDKVTLDKAKAVKAAEFVKSLYKDGYIKAGIEDHQKYFQGGQAGMLLAGTWATGAFEQTKDLHFSAQPFPQLFEKDACWADAHTLIIPTKKSRSEEDTQAAVDFINYVSNKGALTWAGSGQIPSNLSVQTSKGYKNMPYRSSYVEAAKTAVLPSQNSHFYAMKDGMIKNLDTFWTDQATAENAINNLYSELESNLG